MSKSVVILQPRPSKSGSLIGAEICNKFVPNKDNDGDGSGFEFQLGKKLEFEASSWLKRRLLINFLRKKKNYEQSFCDELYLFSFGN